MYLLRVKNHKQYARRSGNVVTEPFPLTSSLVLVVIQNGISKEMFFRSSMETARFRPLTHTHTQVGQWDLLIAHPPCTFLTVTGNSWFNVEKYGQKAIERIKNRADAFKFFMKFINADCDKIAVENPIGFASSFYTKPSQIIQPYWFGEDARKATCLWLKNLPPLVPTNIIKYTVVKTGHGTDSPWHAFTWNLPKDERARARSKTFPGVAEAMADQWGGTVKTKQEVNG